MKKIVIGLITLAISFSALAAKDGKFVQKSNLFPKVKITTSLGSITLELDRSRAPITVNNFLSYVVDGSYKGSVFHRVEKNDQDEDFVIQGGGYDKKYDGLHENPPIFNESGSGMKNEMYSVAMAYQANKPHSATRQFFFNMDDNKHLDPGSDWGFSVFGNVSEGYETLDKIMQVKTTYNEKIGYSFVPETPVIIFNIQVLEEEKLETDKL